MFNAARSLSNRLRGRKDIHAAPKGTAELLETVLAQALGLKGPEAPEWYDRAIEQERLYQQALAAQREEAEQEETKSQPAKSLAAVFSHAIQTAAPARPQTSVPSIALNSSELLAAAGGAGAHVTGAGFAQESVASLLSRGLAGGFGDEVSQGRNE